MAEREVPPADEPLQPDSTEELMQELADEPAEQEEAPPVEASGGGFGAALSTALSAASWWVISIAFHGLMILLSLIHI